jgi:uncharacterized protein
LVLLRPRLLAAALILSTAFANRAAAAEVIPPKPAGYFSDYAGVVSKEAALRFNEQLAQFERDTSNQILVAVFKKMESESSVQDYTYRVKEAWGVGQKGRNNGAVLFVFVEDRQMFIQVGYGLEGALPDITAFDITERHIKPLFKTNNYEAGLAAGIDLMCKAIRGEYTGSGKTKKEEERKPANGRGMLIFFGIMIIFFIITSRGRKGRGYGYSGMGGPFIGGWSSGGGSSDSSGGGFSGFSGGGGSGGGGGAGSSW